MSALETPTLADAAALSACAQACFMETFGHIVYPPGDREAFLADRMGPERYAADIADPARALRIARSQDGSIAGFINLCPNVLPMPAGEPPREQTIELDQLYLRRVAQGTGLADQFMDFAHAEGAARGARAMVLSVFIENVKAQRFYARHGYVEIGKNPYQVGNTIDDDRVWRRWL